MRWPANAGVAVSFTIVVIVLLCIAQPWNLPSRPVVLPQSFYVWQQEWTPGVSSAVVQSASRSTGYAFLSHVVRAVGGNWDCIAVSPDYETLIQTGTPLTATIRAEVSLAPLLAGEKWKDASDFIASLIRETLARAAVKSAGLDGIQLDYDCPTAKLADYARLMGRLREEFPALKWSITALPTWLKSGAFGDLARSVDYFVLQVHSLERPKTVNDPIVLCDAAKIRPSMKSASRFGVPFLVALPTYGYRIYFDAQGKFAAISAEGERLSFPPGHQMRQAFVDPSEMAEVVRDIQNKPIKHCAGIIWFRLPVESDRLNWTWPALAAVMDGRTPTVSYAAEVRNPQPGLYEVWVSNTGEAEHPGEIRIQVYNRDAGILAYDLINGFRDTEPSGTQTLTGPAPELGIPKMVAWYRMSDADTSLSLNGIPEVVR